MWMGCMERKRGNEGRDDIKCGLYRWKGWKFRNKFIEE